MGRDVRRAVIARFITNTGAEASFFIGMWGKAAYEFGAGATALAVLAVVILLASVMGSVVGGVLVDRSDARRVLIATEIALIPAVLSLILADSLTSLLVLGSVTFVLHGLEETAATSLPVSLIDQSDDTALVRVNARLEGAGWLAMVAGPAIGGLLAGFTQLNHVFVFDAATSLVSVLLLLGVRIRPRSAAASEAASETPSGPGEFLEGLRLTRHTPPILLAMAVGALLWFAFGIFTALEPLYFRDVLHQGPEVIGYVNAVFGMGLFAGSAAVARWGRKFAFTEAVWLAAATGLGALVYVGSATMWIVVVGAVVWSFPLGMIFPVIRTLAQRSAPEGMIGRVMGTIATAQNLMSVLPAAIVPFLAAVFGVQKVLIAGGLVPMLAVPLLLARARRQDRATGGQGELDIQPNPDGPLGAHPLA